MNPNQENQGTQLWRAIDNAGEANHVGKETKLIVKFKSDLSIITVIAANAEDAMQEVKWQLDRPGRREYLKKWIKDGEGVMDELGVLYTREHLDEAKDIEVADNWFQATNKFSDEVIRWRNVQVPAKLAYQDAYDKLIEAINEFNEAHFG